MKIIIILIYIIIFILLICFSINIEKYSNIEINKLDSVNMHGNITIATLNNNFDRIKEICIKDTCINTSILNNLPYANGIAGQCKISECTKVCKCDNGEEDNVNCEIENEYKCKNCNENYYLNDAKCFKCEDEKYTQSGNIDRQCCPKGQHYDLYSNNCLINRCTCDGGYPTEGEDCDIHGSEDCSFCKGGASGEYYYYSPSAIDGNRCISCNPEGTLSFNMRKMYSDNHRTPMCCNKQEKYDEYSGKCENVGFIADNLCRGRRPDPDGGGGGEIGEIFNWVGGYCECPGTEIYDLSEKICK